MEQTISVSNIEEYCSKILKANEIFVRQNHYKNGSLYFRGQADKSYSLLPAIARNLPPKNTSMLREERNLIEMAKFKMPEIFHQDMLPIELLALLQHYGIPTRLLDVTENALVALYFACCSQGKKDGEVFVFINKERDVANYPLMNAIADTYRFLGRCEDYPVYAFYQSVIEQPYFLEQRNDAKDDSKKFIEEIMRKICHEPLFVYAPIRSQRQQSQQGAYLLFSNNIMEIKGIGDCFSNEIKPISKDSEIVCAKIQIPYDKKEKFLSDLKLFGISKQTLFSDSIDIVCQEIVENIKERVL